MRFYIASSWKNQTAVELLTMELRSMGHEVLSFVENIHGHQKGCQAMDGKNPIPFEEWVYSERGTKTFKFDLDSATGADCVIYLGPSGTDAWAEIGAAWASKVPVIGIWSKNEPAGLARRMVQVWFYDVHELLDYVSNMKKDENAVHQ